ncbi:DUF397 domain-containing protein [Actinophytocola glycyrrhizae]|uniref:DUF397 domain-containing protein n=1 Tax=Actinophytocola glycyrrhizae TaxID=2044873 RepID=A0ABV9SB03_9PSEU
MHPVMSGHMENWIRAHTTFAKSTFSEGGNCVEVGKAEVVGVRNSKDPDGPVLWFTRSGWDAFACGMLPLPRRSLG